MLGQNPNASQFKHCGDGGKNHAADAPERSGPSLIRQLYRVQSAAIPQLTATWGSYLLKREVRIHDVVTQTARHQPR